MRKLIFVLATLTALLGSLAWTDEMKAECLLRGDCVVDTSGLVRTPGDDTLAAGTELPDDENDMFYCTLYYSNGCGPCKKLLADWQTSEKLCALADPSSPRQVATKCKFATVNIGDPTQAARVAPLKITSVPCVIIQSAQREVNGIPPDIVIARMVGYGGNIDRYADALLDAFRRGCQSATAPESVGAGRYRPKITPPVTLDRDPVTPTAGVDFNVEIPKSTVSKMDKLLDTLATVAVWLGWILAAVLLLPLAVKLLQLIWRILKPLGVWYVNILKPQTSQTRENNHDVAD